MKTKTVVITVVSVSGALLIAAVASCAGFFFVTLRDMDATLSPTVDELFAAMDNDTFGETYDTHTSSELQRTVTREQYEELGLTVKNRLGALKSKSMRQFNVRQLNANRYADVVYNANFENGSGTIRGRFVVSRISDRISHSTCGVRRSAGIFLSRSPFGTRRNRRGGKPLTVDESTGSSDANTAAAAENQIDITTP